MAVKGKDGSFVIDYAETLNNSRWGNPRYKVHFTNGEAYVTQSDATVSWEIPNLLRNKRPVTVHLTRAGRIARIAIQPDN